MGVHQTEGGSLRRSKRNTPTVAGSVARATNAEGRRRRARQQNRPNGLGDHDLRRALQGAAGGVEIRPRRSAWVNELGKGEQDVMRQPVDTGRRENPHAPERLERVLLVGTHLRGRHYGQRSCVPHQQVEHMAAPTRLSRTSNQSLPTESRPHMARSGCHLGGAAK